MQACIVQHPDACSDAKNEVRLGGAQETGGSVKAGSVCILGLVNVILERTGYMASPGRFLRDVNPLISSYLYHS